jgi:hypothetical protein
MLFLNGPSGNINSKFVGEVIDEVNNPFSLVPIKIFSLMTVAQVKVTGVDVIWELWMCAI